MSLQTGQKITRYNWDEIPLPQTVINRFNVIGKDQPEHFIFTNRKGWQIVESDITGVEGDQNVTPQILIEEDDDLGEQNLWGHILIPFHSYDLGFTNFPTFSIGKDKMFRLILS